MGEMFAGRYELLEPIGEGGMGTVWTVQDRNDGRVKAAKILRQSDASTLLRFVREQSVRINHPHVVTPESWAGMDDRVLFTMPLVAGGSVADVLSERGALPAPWVALLLDQLLDALGAVHEAGIVHRDIKPANLLLEPTGTGFPHLRLTDFGVAVPVADPRMTQAGMAIGTPGYMAPEQWQGADPDPRQDLYAVGRVGLEMLTGQRPSRSGGELDVDGFLEHQPGHREAIEGLIRALQWATAPDPDRRPQSAAELRRGIASLAISGVTVAGEPVEIRPRIHTPPPMTQIRRADHPADPPTALGAPATRFDSAPAGSTYANGRSPRRGGGAGWALIALGIIAALAGIYLLAFGG